MQDLEILVNAPNIILLTIEGSLQLSQLMLLDVTSLVEANLDYTKDDIGFFSATEEEKND